MKTKLFLVLEWQLSILELMKHVSLLVMLMVLEFQESCFKQMQIILNLYYNGVLEIKDQTQTKAMLEIQ